jgi:hypothetical protein
MPFGMIIQGEIASGMFGGMESFQNNISGNLVLVWV